MRTVTRAYVLVLLCAGGCSFLDELDRSIEQKAEQLTKDVAASAAPAPTPQPQTPELTPPPAEPVAPPPAPEPPETPRGVPPIKLAKLDSTRRTQAISKARELEILS